MIGTLEFNSAVYYRYAAVNLDLLFDKNHLAKLTTEERKKVIAAFIKATVMAVPGARKNSMNAHMPPSFVLGVYKDAGQPVQLINAFENPVRGTGLVDASRFTRRTTALHPTKSGVIGLLAAALGIDKHGPHEATEIAKLAALECTTITLPKNHRPMLRLSDYHTIGGGYESDDWMKKPRAASGAKLETVLSERHYLLDARFGVLLEGGPAWLEEIAAKLRNPTWGLWLGRKCCIPVAVWSSSTMSSRAMPQKAWMPSG